MCWSAEVSLASWIGAMIMAWQGYGVIDPYLFNFAFVFSQIQLVEFFIWAGFNNEFWSKMGFLFIMMEPVLSLMKSHWIFTVAYASYMLQYFHRNPPEFKTVVNKENGHLDWKWLTDDIIWWAPWFIAFLLPLLINGYTGTFMYSMITILYSWYSYHKFGTIGSMWCWFAIFGWVFLLSYSK